MDLIHIQIRKTFYDHGFMHKHTGLSLPPVAMRWQTIGGISRNDGQKLDKDQDDGQEHFATSCRASERV
jgi:hypothetical protein